MIHEHKKLDGEALVREYCLTKNELIKDQAVRAFLPLVRHIVGRIKVSSYLSLQKEDLYQFGVVGLLYALQRFDPENGTAFKTYAYRRIHGEVIDALRRAGVLSRDQMQKLTKVNAAKEKLSMVWPIMDSRLTNSCSLSLAVFFSKGEGIIQEVP